MSSMIFQPLRDEATLRKAIGGLRPHLELLLKPLEVERLCQYGYVVGKETYRMYECTIGSFQSALYKCAQLHLVPDVRGHAYLIPRKTGPKVKGVKSYEAHFQIGYQGLLELSRRSGEITLIEAHEVYDGDTFDYEYGTSPFIKHIPGGQHSLDKLRGAYCVAELARANRPQFWVVEQADIDELQESHIPAKVTPQDDAYWSPWYRYRAAMYRKTAAKRLATWLPSSVDLQEAVNLDNLTEAGKSQTAYLPAPTEGAKEPVKTLAEYGGEPSEDEASPESE